jgi:NADH-quinone oxidoreductase subunit A
MGQYLPIFCLAVLAVLFAVLSFAASTLLAPRLSTNEKRLPYESGIVPGKAPPRRFPVRFSLIAMIFIVFDIEIIFLYPYAMVHRELGLFGLLAVAIFSASVFESFLYLLSKGGLDWGPVRRVERPGQMISPERTSISTVRRVGLDGRTNPEEMRIMVEHGLLIDDSELTSEPAASAAHSSSGAHSSTGAQ